VAKGYGTALDEFLSVKAKLDPKNIFSSTQSRRLGLSV